MKLFLKRSVKFSDVSFIKQHCVCDVELMKYIQDFRQLGLNYKNKIFVILFPTAFDILWLDIFFLKMRQIRFLMNGNC